uniref:Bm14155 n=1 Tax=Brugia malayi TaxID=6279 RepID=A0A1I9G0U0_BRUMA|nr:Bm14155 [Brugia malayi]
MHINISGALLGIKLLKQLQSCHTIFRPATISVQFSNLSKNEY